MSDNPVKYSDLIQPDSSIDDAIKALTELNSTFKEIGNTIKGFATEIKSSMKSASGATEQARNTIKKAADETSRLEAAYKELTFASSEIGAKTAELKMLTAEKNKESRQEATFARAAQLSYNDLNARLQILVGSYKSLSKEEALHSIKGKELLNTILDLKNQLKQYDIALKASLKTSKETATTVSNLEKAKLKLAAATSEESAQLLKLMIQTKEANEVSKLNYIIANEVEGSYNRLSAQYSLNKIQLNKMSQAERETTVAGKQLVDETNALYQQMIKLQEATGKHSLSVGNYKRAWDGLGMSVNQIMREVPTAGISLNTFFLAISNNVPILVDEIEKVSAANKVAAAEGKATTNIWKSILGAVFSWQSMLVIGLTVLSMYGKEIIAWVGDLFKGKKALDAAKVAQDNLNEAVSKGKKDAVGDLTRLRLLYNATQNINLKTEERVKAVKELKKEYPDYFNKLSNEKILVGQAADSYNVLAASILNAAMARAKEDKIAENSTKILELEETHNKNLAEQLVLERKIKNEQSKPSGATGNIAMPGAPSVSTATGMGVTVLTMQLDNLKEAATATTDEIKSLEEANKKLAESISITDLLFDKDDKTKSKDKKEKDRAEQITKANLDIRKKFAESITALEQDELEKRKLDLINTFDAEKADLMNKYNNDKDLTEQSHEEIIATIKLMEDKLTQDLVDLEVERQARILQVQEESIQLQLDASIEGSQEEHDLKLKLMEINRQQELLANKKLIEAERQDEFIINKKWDSIQLKETADFNYDKEMLMFDNMQTIAEAEFNMVRRTEYEKNKFKLQQEKERWTKVLNMALAGNLKLTDIEKEAILATINAIDFKMKNISDKKYDFYSMIGLKLEDDEKEAIQKAIDTTIQNLQNILSAEIALSEKAIEKSNERLSIAKTNLQNEIDARNEGYASSVAQAQREVDLEKKTLERAQKEKEKAVKAQQALDTVLQTTSLITASAQIWKSLSGIPVIGPALAIAGIAGMWTSFAASKIKAAQVSKAQTYGEGGLEELRGGSHQSGNDIPLGNMPDGRERRAEGGEMLAIFRKSSVKRYRDVIPDVVNSINKGLFESKYINSKNANLGDMNLVISSTTDVGQLEKDVKAIREQGEEKFIFDNGKLVKKYKNLTTIYK